MHPRTEYNRRWREKNIERLRVQKAAYDKAHSFERKDEKVLSGIRERARQLVAFAKWVLKTYEKDSK